jgi:hypothetical protein
LAYSNIRYEGTAKPTNDQFVEVVRLSEAPFDDIIQYDSNLFPVPMPQFLNCWINQPESLTLAVLKNDNIAGYSIIRRCRIGYKIGPLFADTNDLAYTNSFLLPITLLNQELRYILTLPK